MKRTVSALVFLLVARSVLAQDKPEEILSAVVGVQAKVRPNARSAATLGPERGGTGVLPASVAAYDHASGFAVLRLLAAGSGKPLKLGDSTALG